MNMPFLKDLRRRSRASFRTDKSSSDSTAGTVPTTKSSSTLNSSYDSSTPPLANQSHPSPLNLPPVSVISAVAGRPGCTVPQIKRNSIPVLDSHGNVLSKSPTFPYAPRVLSVSDNSWVHQNVLLIYGQAGDSTHQPVDGRLKIFHHQDAFPPLDWPVCDSHFKALVYLTPGPNRLRLEFTTTEMPSDASNGIHSSSISINYLPLLSSPPLQLAILVARDSSLSYDAVPERQRREGNDLDAAVRKFRMAAYLWQAFTGEHMYRNGFGRRCFRFEEEWQTGTLTNRDREAIQMRNEAKVHIIRSEKSTEEIRNLNVAQQYEKAEKKGDLFGYAAEAVRAHFKPVPGQKQYISILILDARWDKEIGTIRGHAALGGSVGDMQLGIFGSHCLQSYPSSMEEVVPAFSDCTETDTNYVANDCNDAGSNWEAANIGIGAHLHETGHLFGCPHQENGIMSRDYVRFNRTFTCREPYSTRTQSPGQQLCLQKDECAWHRLDCLRFRYHPCFRLPADPLLSLDDSIQAWPVGSGTIIFTAVTGIAFVELSVREGACQAHMEFLEGGSSGNNISSPPRQVTLNEADLRSRVSENGKIRQIRLELHSAGQGKLQIEDFGQLSSKSAVVKLPNGQRGFHGSKLGLSNMKGSQPEMLILESAMVQKKLLVQIKVYHGRAVDGIEFIHEDFSSQLIGKKGGKEGGSDFLLDTRKGESLIGFYVRAGQWIDGIEILTSLGRRSGVFGNGTGGTRHNLIPPRGYRIAGVAGSCGQWLDGFSLIITR